MTVSPFHLVRQRFLDDLRRYLETDRGRLIHAGKTAIALILGMGICMRLELTTPRTAMVSIVIIMMHQQSGMVIARGFYRGLGMLAGSIMGLLLMACFAQAPLPFFMALACWLGLCVWGASYYRNYQSYGFVLAGYATAITAVPAWSNPYGIFDGVIYSLSEVAIGITCAGLVSALVLPQHAAPSLFLVGQQHCSSFLFFVRRMLHGALPRAELDAMHLKLVSERAQIENLRSAAVFEDPELRLSNPLMAQLNRNFLDAAAGFHSMRQIRERTAHSADARSLGAIDSLFNEMLPVIPEMPEGKTFTLAEIEGIQARLKELMATIPQRIEYHLACLSDASEESRQYYRTAAVAMYFSVIDLDAYLEDFLEVRKPPQKRRMVNAGRLPSQRFISTANQMAAGAAGLRAMIAVLVIAALWVSSGWQAGASAVVAVAITSALFAVAPQPSIASRQIFAGCLAGWLVAFAFDFFVLPHLDGFPLLAACVAPIIMLGSYINTFPRTAVLGLGFNIYFCFIGNITNPAVFDPASLMDTGFAMLLGIGAAAAAFAFIVPYGSRWAINAYLRQIRRLVVRDACRGTLREDSLLRFESGMRDFVLQVAMRPADDVGERRSLLGWAFASLEIGRVVIQLRSDSALVMEALPEDWASLEREWQAAIASLFERVTRDRHDRALAATRAAAKALALPPRFDPESASKLVFRMRAYLHATELSLLDDTLPLNTAEETRW